MLERPATNHTLSKSRIELIAELVPHFLADHLDRFPVGSNVKAVKARTSFQFWCGQQADQPSWLRPLSIIEAGNAISHFLTHSPLIKKVGKNFVLTSPIELSKCRSLREVAAEASPPPPKASARTFKFPQVITLDADDARHQPRVRALAGFVIPYLIAGTTLGDELPAERVLAAEIAKWVESIGLDWPYRSPSPTAIRDSYALLAANGYVHAELLPPGKTQGRAVPLKVYRYTVAREIRGDQLPPIDTSMAVQMVPKPPVLTPKIAFNAFILFSYLRTLHPPSSTPIEIPSINKLATDLTAWMDQNDFYPSRGYTTF